MQTAKNLLISSIVLALLLGGATLVSAQKSIAKEKRISLSQGKSKTIRGKTDSQTSYVYKFRAQKDQNLEAKLTSEGSAATFSIVPPVVQTLENAAAVTQWSGALPEAGEYSIVVVMNSKAATKMPYTLELTIK
jgi:P pilus assembly chaperone PapD